MKWDRDPLWAKAKLFFERALRESRDDPQFGLWCSLGLELLARAAVASISPTLLAESDREHKHLLYALGRGSESTFVKSLQISQVLSLCRVLFPDFSDEDHKSTLALICCRNEELHTGLAAFSAYPAKMWLPGFYHACRSLAMSMQESLLSLLGREESEIAESILTEDRKGVEKNVRDSIAKRKAAFEEKPTTEREQIHKIAENETAILSHLRRHRVVCPACGCSATVGGRAFGPEHVEVTEDGIEVRQSVAPSSFQCKACGLQLSGYAGLDVAGLGGHYTRKSTYSPEEYYDLVDLETFDFEAYYYEQYGNPMEFDNE